MRNRGYVTLFLCLMTSVLLLLGVFILKIVDMYTQEAKASMAVRSGASSIKAEYNSYIFERYHILLFDSTCNGRGEAALEEKMKGYIEDNLEEEYEVTHVAINRYDRITENQCEALRDQIESYIVYGGIAYGVEKIEESTGGFDTDIPSEIWNNMELDVEGGGETETGKTEENSDESHDNLSDPREFTEGLDDDALLQLVVPEDMSIDNEDVNLTEVPSLKYVGIAGVVFGVANSFDDYDQLKDDLKSHQSWGDKLKSISATGAYALLVFNRATNQEVNEEAVFGCEIEYLIGGMGSDVHNLKNVVNKIIAIRMPVNYTYLLKNPAKMGQITSISMPLSIITLIPEPVLKYLIAGCWSYVEAIVEVRALLDGDRLSFFKNDSNWVTDLNDLENSVTNDVETDETGLSYEDYLLILMSLDPDKTYYRILDLIQLNTRIHNEDFLIENCAVGFHAEVSVSTKDSNFDFSIGEAY